MQQIQDKVRISFAFTIWTSTWSRLQTQLISFVDESLKNAADDNSLICRKLQKTSVRQTVSSSSHHYRAVGQQSHADRRATAHYHQTVICLVFIGAVIS